MLGVKLVTQPAISVHTVNTKSCVCFYCMYCFYSSRCVSCYDILLLGYPIPQSPDRGAPANLMISDLYRSSSLTCLVISIGRSLSISGGWMVGSFNQARVWDVDDFITPSLTSTLNHNAPNWIIARVDHEREREREREREIER